ncbi:AMP-binding protein [Halalkalibacter nanhaiisediminis]|uniref:Acyl-CoA synthetase n=1 Tax=Halalkalibacter nanhaiisediminis TaxID=688079 RepID=A0A562QQ61_9BACI|nr:AMP-binding protein [Halalkalibacter nanhaiisediminis]TWI58874.1 long-chain acyl-CoA synthetase [Halalkalibacter nanhaiisediminis]
MSTEKTLPKLLLERAEKTGNNVALRQKKLGIWNEVTWFEYLEHVKHFSIALATEYKLQRGETVAIIGDNRPQWLFSQMAAQSLGAISVGLYQESLPHQLVYSLNQCEAQIVVVEDQEQVDKLLEVEAELSYVKHIIYYNDQGMSRYEHEKLRSFDDLLHLGLERKAQYQDFFREELEKGQSTDIALYAYTSGTTDTPKAVMISHQHLLITAIGLSEVDRMEEQDDYLSFLPLAWIDEQVMSFAMSLLKGIVINFPEQSNTVLSDLREIGPHTLLAPPRVYQTLMSQFTIRIQDTSWFKSKVYHFFKKYADKVADAKLKDKQASLGTKCMYGLGEWLVFSAIRDHLGFARIRRGYAVGATLGSESFRFFHSIGVNVKQTYSGTELGGIICVHRDNQINVNSAGPPLPNTEVKVASDGEILIKRSVAFRGYHHQEAVNEKEEGFISLGDTGYLDEFGHIHVVGRQEEVINQHNGEPFSPSLIENKLKVSPYIQEAVVYGKEKPYMVAILTIDMMSVGRWAEKNQIVYTTYSDLTRKPEVSQLIEKEVVRLMDDLPDDARIKKFVILHKPFNASEEEMTQTYKIRRKLIEERYQAVFASLYGGGTEVVVTEKIVTGNGDESVVQTNLKVVQLEAEREVA